MGMGQSAPWVVIGLDNGGTNVRLRFMLDTWVSVGG